MTSSPQHARREDLVIPIDPAPGYSPPPPMGISRWKVAAAFLIAAGADLLQICLFPLFAEGIASPLNAFLDIGTCIVLTMLIGWHYAFIPSFLMESLPMFDLVPSWTLAVVLAVSRKSKRQSESRAERVVSARETPATPPLLSSPAKPPIIEA